MKINITDEVLKQIDLLDIKNIRIIFHGQGCGGPVLSMVEGQQDSEDAVIKVNDINFSIKQELSDKFKIIDINYSNTPGEGFSIEADNCGGCIRCNGCWLNTINTDIITK